MKKVITKRNFLLVSERTSRSKNGVLVIRTSGYTSTEQANLEPWMWTQLKTLPHSNRSHLLLPDPVISPNNPLKHLYEQLDCTAFNLYFTPQCNGLKYAITEAGEYFEKKLFPKYKKHCLIGHSKGGLFIGGLTKELNTKTNIILVSPTFGTIMGSEELVIQQLEKYKHTQDSNLNKFLLIPEIATYKKITHVLGSRRPIDYDMAINSRFIKEDLDLSNLKNHRTMLVTASCPIGLCNPADAIFRHYGKFLGLDKRADGMVRLCNQRLPIKYGVDKVVELTATHPTVLKKAVPCITDFLKI